MISALPPRPQVRVRRALGLAATLLILGLGSAPALSAPADGLFTVPEAPDQPTPAPTPPGGELRPPEPPGLLDPLLPPEPAPDPAPTPAPAPGPDPATTHASAPGPEPAPAPEDDAGESTLSHAPAASSTPPGDDAKVTAAEQPQGTGFASPEPTTGAAAPETGASDQGPGAATPAAPAPSGTATAATLMPVIDAVSRMIGPSRRSREIAPTGAGGRSPAPVRVAPLGAPRAAASTGRPVATIPVPAAAEAVRHAPVAAPGVHRAPAPPAIPDAAQRVADVVADAGRSPWLPIALLLLDRVLRAGPAPHGRRLEASHAGRDEPDDELIEL